MTSRTRTYTGVAVAAMVLLTGIATARSQVPDRRKQLAELRKRVNESIALGTRYLRLQQARDGGFGNSAFRAKPGNSALCVLALRKSGAAVDDPAIKRCIPFLLKYAGQFTRANDQHAVYNCGITMLALDSLGEEVERYGKTVHRPFNLRAMQKLGGTLRVMQAADGGWGYEAQKSHDLSNTQYALLGLWAASRNGLNVPNTVWGKASEYVLAMQRASGGFVYSSSSGNQTRAMTAAGIGSLAICYLQVKSERLNRQDISGAYISEVDKLQQPGAAADAPAKKRVTKAELSVEAGFKWFQARGLTELDPYYMYAMERACSLTKTQKIGDKDWYVTLAESIVRAQRGDGSWAMMSVGNDNDPILSTCWCLLVLCRSTEQMFNEYPEGQQEYYSTAADPAIAAGQTGAAGRSPSDEINPADPRVAPASQRPGMVVPKKEIKLPHGAQAVSRADELKAIKEYLSEGKSSLAEKLVSTILDSGPGEDADELKKIKACVFLGNNNDALAMINSMLGLPATPQTKTKPTPPAATGTAKPPATNNNASGDNQSAPEKSDPTAAEKAQKAEKLIKLARNYAKLGLKPKADKLLTEIINDNPGTDVATQAQELRDSLYR